MRPMLPEPLKKSYLKAKEMIDSAEDIKIYSHIDCDGICAGALLSSTLDRQDKEHDIEFIGLDKLDDIKIENQLTIFSDLGSGQPIDRISNSSSQIIILDHHPPLRTLHYNSKVSGKFLEINPLFYGIDGTSQISGGGLSYLLAKKFGLECLSWIGVLSAIGDMQHSLHGKLKGLNEIVLQDSVEHGLVHSSADLSLYGRQTRPLFVALSYFGDVNLPITNNKTEAILCLKKLGIAHKNNDRYRTLTDLTTSEKSKLFSELVRLLTREVPEKYIKYIPRLIMGDIYEFLNEEEYTYFRDASEFSTAINACTRNNNADIALDILKGDRLEAVNELENLARLHRKYLAQKLAMIEDEDLLASTDNLQYFHAPEIKNEVIGTITGMFLSHGDWQKPILGFTGMGKDDGLKVSLRCSRLLSYDGIHFGHIIKKVAEKVGGTGGGHAVACGAYIPSSRQHEFIRLFNNALDGLI